MDGQNVNSIPISKVQNRKLKNSLNVSVSELVNRNLVRTMTLMSYPTVILPRAVPMTKGIIRSVWKKVFSYRSNLIVEIPRCTQKLSRIIVDHWQCFTGCKRHFDNVDGLCIEKFAKFRVPTNSGIPHIVRLQRYGYLNLSQISIRRLRWQEAIPVQSTSRMESTRSSDENDDYRSQKQNTRSNFSQFRRQRNGR
jgi:hypothetical protein